MSDKNLVAEKGGENDPHQHHDTVHVKHLGEHEKATFKVASSNTLQQIWDQAYLELEVAKQERDVFQAPQKKGNPTDLTPYLSVKLEDAQDRELCEDDFEIAAGTGGA